MELLFKGGVYDPRATRRSKEEFNYLGNNKCTYGETRYKRIPVHRSYGLRVRGVLRKALVNYLGRPQVIQFLTDIDCFEPTRVADHQNNLLLSTGVAFRWPHAK
jgi:hypothetical protein